VEADASRAVPEVYQMLTTGTTLPTGEGALAGECIWELGNGLRRDFDDERQSQTIDDEIERRLHNLEGGAVVNTRMDCRSRFSRNGTGQVQIRMRLKQVTGMVSN
jgi:hypothetical protein